MSPENLKTMRTFRETNMELCRNEKNIRSPEWIESMEVMERVERKRRGREERCTFRWALLSLLRGLALLLFSIPFFSFTLSPHVRGSLRSNRRDLLEISHLDVPGLNYLSLCIMLSCISVFIPICFKRKFIQWLNNALTYEYSRISLGLILSLFSFSSSSMLLFDFTLGLLVSGSLLFNQC